jgi:translation initiation factor 2-alpha kinase 4
MLIENVIVVDLVINRLPSGQRSAVIDIMSQTRTLHSQKRALLLKRGLLRSTADELELLAETGVWAFSLFLPVGC